MRSVSRMLGIGAVLAGIALPALAQSPLPRSSKAYTFMGRLSAANLVNVVGPASVTVRVRVLWGGRPIGREAQLRLRPVDTSRDTWVGEFRITGVVPEGVYVRLSASSDVIYPNGTALPLRGATVVFTGINSTIDFGIVPLVMPWQ